MRDKPTSTTPALRTYAMGHELGKACAERRIVEWLRAKGDHTFPLYVADQVADAIERGEHRA